MTGGPYLYDDGPAELHTGTPRRRHGLLLAIFGGTVVVAVLMVLAVPLFTGTQEQRAKDVVGVFLTALERGDTTTADQLLCAAEKSRLAPGEIAATYRGSGAASVVRADKAEVGSATVARVEVRWSDGPPTRITVVGENGPHICGVSPPR